MHKVYQMQAYELGEAYPIGHKERALGVCQELQSESGSFVAGIFRRSTGAVLKKLTLPASYEDEIMLEFHQKKQIFNRFKLFSKHERRTRKEQKS